MLKLAQRRDEIKVRMNEICDLVEKEKRAMTEVEENEFKTLTVERKLIESRIEAGVKPVNDQKASRAEQCAQVLGRMDNAGASVTTRLARRTESTILTAGDSNIIPLTIEDVIKPLQDEILFSKYCTVGAWESDIVRPMPTAVSCTIEGETDETAEQKLVIAGDKPVTKRISAVLPISNTCIKKAGDRIYQIVRDLAADGFNNKLNDWVFATTAPATGVNAPFVKTADLTSATSAVFTFAEIVSLKGTFMKAKNKISDTVAWACNGKMYAYLESLPIASGSDKMVLENGKILGIPVLVNNGMGDAYLGLADFKQVYIDFYGDVHFIFDPITKAANGVTRVILNADVALSYPKTAAFVLGKLKA